ncbi:transcriptional regulator [Paraburkholderia azotifigens]|uniref:transcriptional regulator n=1 Tax=Paraburkholderia azotifigens TaxID=2057004 RepID=UPI0038B87143
MDKLIAYLNSLTKDQRTEFAARCGTSEGYMRKARSTNQRFRCELCVRIEMVSDGAVTRPDLRDDWADVWPELAANRKSNGGATGGSNKGAKMSRACSREAA